MKLKSILFLTSMIALSAMPVAAQSRAPDTGAVAPIHYFETPLDAKPRVVVTTDGEADDSNSLIRYLLYSTDFQTEGLIYSSSEYHWAGDWKGTKFDHPGREYDMFGLHLCPCTSYRWPLGELPIDRAVDAYAEVYPNLHVHDSDYPTPQYLRSIIRWGNVDFEGEMSHDTAGSDLIKSLLLDDEQTPVYLLAWGGQNTIARALKSIEEQFGDTPQWPSIREKVIRKAVIIASGEQDDTYADYIKPHWPEIRYVQQAGGINLGYNTQSSVSKQDAVYFSPAWTKANVSDRGPLGSLYRVWGDGIQMVRGDIFAYFGVPNASVAELRKQGYIVWTPPHEKGAFLGEGDDGTFLNLIDNGLRGYRDDSFGGWGGYRQVGPSPFLALMRKFQEQAKKNPDAMLQFMMNMPRQPTNPFLQAAQRDFAVRLLWSVTPEYKDANHNPQVTLQTPQDVSAMPGQLVTMSATTSDPDHNKVTLRWWDWDKAGSYDKPIKLDHTNGLSTSFRVPRDAKVGQTIQIVAEATDDGTPALTRYAKVVVTVLK
ncbi:MAG: DUF1593 domain-containing protein [Alphaproteobacteria bacterium]|nr:DUF1593 domain-containing protein [Alphaproteobacteria bacterium]MDE2494044.1 DUF1593 domain-containing protein [Alphaproteobacteria bacterium]